MEPRQLRLPGFTRFWAPIASALPNFRIQTPTHAFDEREADRAIAMMYHPPLRRAA